MSGRFEGKLVFVTGASVGIGRAASLAFAREGATVAALSRSAKKLEALAAEGPPAKVLPIVADVTDASGMEAACTRLLETRGAPHVVVANAGLGLDAPFVATTDNDLRRVFEVNLFGVVRTVRPFLSAMLARGTGRILLVSSVVGKRGTPNYSAYSASKFALHGLADAVRAEIWGSGVTLGVVCPSSTATEFQDRALKAGRPQRRVRVQTHSSESVAQALVRMAASRRRELVLSPEGKLMAWLNRWTPGLLDRILHRVLVAKP